MSSLYPIRDAVPSDAPFLAKCILAGMHMYDFEEYPSDKIKDILAGLTRCEAREDTLYTFRNTRVAVVGGEPVGALLSYPGDKYPGLKQKTFREYWPAFFEQFSSDDPETDTGEWYLDSLAVHPDFRKMGIGKALLQDGIDKGLSLGFTKVALVADPEYPNLVKMYEFLGFVPEERRHAFGTDFLRMVYHRKV